MNLAFLAKRYDQVGGTEKDLYELTRLLAARDHEIHIYCGQIRTEAASGVKLHQVPLRALGRTALLKAVASMAPEMARNGEHDLVYSFARTIDQDVIRCGGGIHKAYLDMMAPQLSPAARWFRKIDPYHRALLSIEAKQFASGAYKRVTAISQVVKSEIQDHFSVPEECMDIIYDGIDAENFSPERNQAAAEKLRKEYDLGTDPVLLFLGNGFQRKGLDTLLQALAHLDIGGFTLLVVGTDQHAAAYQVRADKLKGKGRVIFTGVQREPAPFYQVADLFVLPSLHEAFGNVVLEALASGTPVVTTSSTGAAEILTPPLDTGIVPASPSPEQLAEGITRTLQTAVPADVCRTLGTRFTFEANAVQVEDQCRRLLESPSA